MSYILTNPSALSALQSLQQTQSQLSTVQNEVSTGLSVASAKDNASYWSIATQLSSDSGVVTAASSALTQSQSVLSTASSAISSIITTIQSIQTALTEAAEPGADISNLQTTLTGLGEQLTEAVSGASFNGLNVLDGSTQASGSALDFVSGFNATSTGGTITTINLSTQALVASGTGSTAGSGILEGGTGSATGTGTDLLTLGTTVTDSTTATAALSGVATVLNAVENYSATIGSAQDQMTAASTFNTDLTTNYSTGVAGLVDANMNTASTQLQALQTQEQLGIQALSIANQNSQLILKLFNG